MSAVTTKRAKPNAEAAADPLATAALTYTQAIAAEKAALRAVEEARRQRLEAGQTVQAAREPLVELIVDAARQGVRQRDIIARIGGAYSRENVRKLCRLHGVDPTE